MNDNYIKSVEFIDEIDDVEILKILLKDLIFYNDDEFIENFIVDEYNL